MIPSLLLLLLDDGEDWLSVGVAPVYYAEWGPVTVRPALLGVVSINPTQV